MRLQTKTGIVYALLSILLFGAGGLLYYRLVRSELWEEVDERLYSTKSAIAGQLARLVQASPIGVQIQVDGPAADSLVEPVRLIDTALYDTRERELVPYRQMTYSASEQGQSFRVVLRHSLIESEDLLESIATSILAVFGLLVAALVVLNLTISRAVWAPFNRTLAQLRNYDVNTQTRLAPDKTSTEEFRKLNEALERMTDRIHRDFISLKEFTENASHELQTPLSVILTKLEALLSSDLPHEALDAIRDAHAAADRLSQLNRALLLLTRIEGGQYAETETVSLSAIAREQLEQCSELAQLKGLSVTASLDAPLNVSVNPSLATTLVSVLLKNAIAHNATGGFIRVAASEESLTIENSGPPLAVDPTVLFERFKKASQASPSLGLGLSIARKICDVHGLSLRYDFRESTHTLSVSL